jgi:hypothetical protein
MCIKLGLGYKLRLLKTQRKVSRIKKKMGGFFSAPVKFYPIINPNDLRSDKDGIVEILDLAEQKDSLLLYYAKTGKYPEELCKN